MAEIIEVDIQSFNPQLYKSQETSLILSSESPTMFTSQSYIEYAIYTLDYNLISIDYDFQEYTLSSTQQVQTTDEIQLSSINVYPSQSLINNGFDEGSYISYYNFFDKEIGSNLEQLYISEISSDRTEVRLDSNDLDNDTLVEQTNKFIQKRENSEYFLDFHLNFGDNNLPIANNIRLDLDQPDNPTILVKLYEPLPDEFDLNSQCWVITVIEEPRAFQVTFEDPIFELNETVNIKGPNFNIPIKGQVNNSTPCLNYNDLINTSLTSSYQQLNSLLEEKEIDVNIDYTSFDEYIHFSSAETRLRNFYYKIQLIEQYSSSLSILDNTTDSTTVSGSKVVYQSRIDNIITNFDGYDYFLYYDNNARAWPKTNSQKPYTLAKSDSTTVLNWIGSTNEASPYYGGLLLSASLYDDQNKDNLLFSIPEYLRDDPENNQYELFVQMVAQHYDNIWVYHKEITKKYDNDNRLEFGVSKDIVADAIRDFGVKLYQNNFSNDDLYTALLGITPQGGLFPFPNITGSLPTPSGYEYIEYFISASNDFIPLDDVNKSIYKRIYHNLPYLLKAKGTIPGLKTLITSYGIPDTILRINEYGGKDKINVNDWDHWQREFNYAFSTSGSNFISSSWGLNTAWNAADDVPGTLMFRFKTDGLPTTNIPYSQSLWYGDGGTAITLTYTGSAYTSGSYSGSIIDPYYQYATLTFYPDTNVSTQTASVYLPFYDGGWWSVMVTKNSDTYNLYSQNKIYEGGENGTSLGFNASNSITYNSANWAGTLNSYFPVSFSVFDSAGYDVDAYDVGIYDGTGSLVNSYSPFSGSYQEIRYYTVPISESVFKDYTMNPHSFEGNSLNSAPNELAFRAPIGGELYLGQTSIHPKVTGSWVTTHSFASDSSFYYDASPYFVPNTEYFFADQPVAGIRNIIKDKIRVEDNVVPTGSTLSPFISVLQQSNISQSYTPNINYLEVAFSPQNEINEDIMDQIGFFNLGEYIGDPRLRSSSATSYPDLDNLRNEYFQKYTKNYNLTDFIRLIKFFDNSLFKMIKDFVPARTSLASGIVIKQHLLERNKYPQPQLEWKNITYSGTLKPQWNGYEEGTVENTVGGTGGSLEKFNLSSNTSQSWNESLITPSGSVLVIRNSQEEFYNGEFSGSIITVTTQSLNPAYPREYQSFDYNQVHYYATSSAETSIFESNYISKKTTPSDGEILFYHDPFAFAGFTPSYNIFTTKYLKISKTDCDGNNNSNVLGNINKALIYNEIAGVYVEYDLLVLNEKPTYYLFSLSNSVKYSQVAYPNQIFDYTVSASLENLTLAIPSNPPYDLLLTSSIDNLNYYDSSSGYTTLGDTPNTRLDITASITIDNSSFTTPFIIFNYSNTDYTNIIATSNTALGGFQVLPTGVSTITISGSFYPIKGNSSVLSVITIPSTNLTIQNVEFLLTQSRAVSTSSCDPVIFEPYITLPNFANSDENALFNNAFELRDSSTYLDIDYSKGATEPVNFDLLISGSANKAKVQDSNYTTKRHIIPRYEGSRTTSQKINVWTKGDAGTFGKLPTVESLKTNIAYCDWIGGWPPDRMEASAIHVLYLIDEDGNITTPNFSENSLEDVQGTFQSGERLSISTKTIGSGEAVQYRNIIRGGSRIEPILYTQIKKQPGATWATEITLEDIETNSGGVTGNYQNNGGLNETPSSDFFLSQRLKLSPNPQGSSFIGSSIFNTLDYNFYQVPVGVLNENVSLKFTISAFKFGFGKVKDFNAVYGLVLKKNDETVGFFKDVNNENYQRDTFLNETNPAYVVERSNQPGSNLTITVPPGTFVENDEFSFELIIDYISGEWQGGARIRGGSYSITQIPAPTIPITVGTNNIWGYFDKTNYPYIITSSNAVSESLGIFFNNPTVKGPDIEDSGFNPIALPWSIEYGDEFRFEGDERFSYTVGPIFGPNDTVFNYPYDNQPQQRLTPTGSIEVHFDKNLPVSASNFNLDHFLIRRYVDDASQIIMEGFRPLNSQGPYLVKPEYVTEKLDKGIDDIILLLKEKGIITGDEGIQ